MSGQKLKIAILGLSQNGRDLLDAAEGTGLFQIEAVGDVDPEVAEKIARKLFPNTFRYTLSIPTGSNADILKS